MNDHQDVRVLQVRGRQLVLEVTEVHPDMDTLDSVIRSGRPEALAKLAAELLLDVHGMDNALAHAGHRVMRHQDGVWVEPDEFVAHARWLAQGPRRARLLVELTRDEYAAEFLPGMRWDALAGPADQEFADSWGRR